MDRTELGQKIMTHLAIQGEIEGAKKNLAELKGDKEETDKVIKAGKQAEIKAGKLDTEIKSVSDKLAKLNSELSVIDTELKKVNAAVPVIGGAVEAPTHYKF